jgi:hypothetical protein
VYIPRDFRGSLTLTSSVSQWIKISGELAKGVALFTESGPCKTYFVGDLPESSDYEGTWQGDEITVEVRKAKQGHWVNTSRRNDDRRKWVSEYGDGVQVSFVDEAKPEQKGGQCTCC